jgi:hypothetical protein
LISNFDKDAINDITIYNDSECEIPDCGAFQKQTGLEMFFPVRAAKQEVNTKNFAGTNLTEPRNGDLTANNESLTYSDRNYGQTHTDPNTS